MSLTPDEMTWAEKLREDATKFSRVVLYSDDALELADELERLQTSLSEQQNNYARALADSMKHQDEIERLQNKLRWICEKHSPELDNEPENSSDCIMCIHHNENEGSIATMERLQKENAQLHKNWRLLEEEYRARLSTYREVLIEAGKIVGYCIKPNASATALNARIDEFLARIRALKLEVK